MGLQLGDYEASQIFDPIHCISALSHTKELRSEPLNEFKKQAEVKILRCCHVKVYFDQFFSSLFFFS